MGLGVFLGSGESRLDRAVTDWAVSLKASAQLALVAVRMFAGHVVLNLLTTPFVAGIRALCQLASSCSCERHANLQGTGQPGYVGSGYQRAGRCQGQRDGAHVQRSENPLKKKR